MTFAYDLLASEPKERAGPEDDLVLAVRFRHEPS